MKTTSFEISKKLAEIGFEVKHLMAYHFNSPDEPHLAYFDTGCPEIPAYDLETILEALPKYIIIDDEKAYLAIDAYFNISYDLTFGRYFYEHKKENEPLADTAARLLIRLHEEGLIKF